jgi:hypothetical protein
LDVFDERFYRLGCIVNEDSRCSSSAEGFYPKAAGAGKQIKHRDALNTVRKNIKDGFLQIVRCRPNSHTP